MKDVICKLEAFVHHVLQKHSAPEFVVATYILGQRPLLHEKKEWNWIGSQVIVQNVDTSRRPTYVVLSRQKPFTGWI